jgi:hypothetical protein
MVVVLYWVFDRTEDIERTRALVKRCAPFVAKIVSLSRYRVFRPLVRDAGDMIQEFVLPTIGKAATPSTGPATTAGKRKRRTNTTRQQPL